jgi:nickel/cobalt transporter (NicO) family protein
MNATTPALIAAAAGVGFGHAIMPDHWLPLALVGRTRRYPIARVARLSGLAGIAHVLVSLLLGGIIIAIGLRLRSGIEHAQSLIVGGVLLLTGMVFIALELSGRGHWHGPGGHSRHAHGKGAENHAHLQPLGSVRVPRRHAREPDRGLLGRAAGIMVPFGAAASPDLTILPVFLAATAVGIGTAVGSVIAFAAVTIATIVCSTLIVASGGYQVGGRWLERWGNSISAGVLVVIGALVVAGAI